eukprot:2392070-Amphidinium_carterae.2
MLRAPQYPKLASRYHKSRQCARDEYPCQVQHACAPLAQGKGAWVTSHMLVSLYALVYHKLLDVVAQVTRGVGGGEP